MNSRRARVREALQRAAQGTRSDVARLVAAAESLILEARRRRETRPSDVPSALGARARSALPRLALATAVAVALAVVALLAGDRTASTRASSFDSLVLGGSSAGSGDVLLDAVLASGKNDG